MEDVRKAGTLPVEQSWLTDLIKRIMPAFGVGHRDSWLEGSVNRRIFSALMTVGVLSSVVMLVSSIRDLVVAHQFGIGDSLDAFLVAYLLPATTMSVVAGSFNAALIPTYIQVRDQEGKESAQRLFSSVLVWSAALLIALSASLALTASYFIPLLGSGFDADKLAQTRSLFFVLLPVLPLNGIFVIWAAVLNASDRFAIAAITPVITPLLSIAIIHEFGNAWGIYSYAIIIPGGAVIEGLVLATALKRQGMLVAPRWHGLDPALKQVMKQYAPMIAGAFIMSGTSLVDQAMAAMLGSGSVSVLSYGKKITTVAVGISAMALSAAVMPHFSRMVAARDWGSVRQTLKSYIPLILLATVSITGILIFFSRPMVRLLFQRGAFTVSDTLRVASVQSLCILQLPFYVLGIFFVRLISAFKANHILMWGATISFVLNMILDYLFMKWLGVPGIALSTSLVYVVALGYLSTMSFRLLRNANRAV
jgi:putative peptidoglycan lipid II flippase